MRFFRVPKFQITYLLFVVSFFPGPAGDPGDDGEPARSQALRCVIVESGGGGVSCDTLPGSLTSPYQMMGCHCGYSCARKEIRDERCDCNCANADHVETKGTCCRLELE